MTISLGWTDQDNLPVTLSTQMEKIIRDEPIEAGEGILHHDEGADLIPANIELSGMEMTLVNAMSREFTMKSYLSELKKDYDYILIDCMPSLCIVRNLTDDEAIIIMVDSNLQREQILPSEKAFAYKIKLSAMNRQGQCTDLTSVPVAQKSGKTSRELLAEKSPDSNTQIQRYIYRTHFHLYHLDSFPKIML